MHYLVVSVRFGAIMGGRMSLRSLDCVMFMYELYVVRVLVLRLLCRNLWSIYMLWSRVILSW